MSDVSATPHTAHVRPVDVLLAPPSRAARVTHVEKIPARGAVLADWPSWLDDEVRIGLMWAGVMDPWSHQVKAAEAAWQGRSVVIATGTASGKSLAYLMPALTAARGGRKHGETTLYLSPTKALAADQLRTIDELAVRGVVATTYDGDTSHELRNVARSQATYLLTNPDMLHRSILPSHHRWAAFLKRLRFVVVDECHGYRGVFGSHVAHLLRRLRRICLSYGAEPTFVLASATTSDPAESAEQLTGLPVEPIVDDGSPRGAKEFVLWQPQSRRSVLPETSELLADLVRADARAVAFVRSRRAAEVVAEHARQTLAALQPAQHNQVASYRAGYLPHERRDLETRLNDGRLRGMAATSALELGVDITGLDAVLIAGWPGTRASLWQQAGRAGRSGAESAAVFVADDDPLDRYVVQHPETIFGRPVEATVLDPGNPQVLTPHLCAAAAELPLREADVALFGPEAPTVVNSLEQQRKLRRRGGDAPTWHWIRRERAALVDLRGTGEPIVTLVESSTGRVLGTVDGGRAHASTHTGAVYVHQGETYLVEALDLDDHVAMVRREAPGYTTTARSISSLRIVQESQAQSLGAARLALGAVEVSSQVVGFVKRDVETGSLLGDEPLDLPERHLRTRAVWWTLPESAVSDAGVSVRDAPGAAHAAEHGSIGLLPLVASCDRWDVGGLSTVRHVDTGMMSVFVYDGYAGGAGFAERGYQSARSWLTATRDVVSECPCDDGCPSCVQSPKCGNGNQPLHKAGAQLLLNALLT